MFFEMTDKDKEGKEEKSQLMGITEDFLKFVLKSVDYK